MSESEIKATGATKVILKNYCVLLDENDQVISGMGIDGEPLESKTPSGKRRVMWIPKGRKIKLYTDSNKNNIKNKIKNKDVVDFEINNGEVKRGLEHVE